MFFHSMKYTFLELIRDKSSVFWCFAFPLILGTLFSFAFGGLGTEESFSPIAVAVVIDESTEEELPPEMLQMVGISEESITAFDQSESIRAMFDGMSEPGEDQFLIVTYADEEEALDLLEKKEVYGIINVDMPQISDYILAENEDDLNTAPLQLTISAEMNSDPLFQSILSCFVEQFNMQYDTISTIAMENPQKLPELMESINIETDYLVEESLGADSLDEASTYFFNLIAMTCMFAADRKSVV